MAGSIAHKDNIIISLTSCCSFAHKFDPAGQAGDIAFDGFNILQMDVRKTTATGIQAVSDDASDQVFIVAAANHICRIRAPGNGVVRANLFGTLAHIRYGRNGDAAQVLEFPQHINLST
ncbi:MAG: hypothetical protein A2X48_21980 [Lentisphaerae bacterium GWF2_49_21]|nr:MAG: hypothetical protein A2X48_21980 [Lentisphaerae bacterium GWF2_49_21]